MENSYFPESKKNGHKDIGFFLVFMMNQELQKDLQSDALGALKAIR